MDSIIDKAKTLREDFFREMEKVILGKPALLERLLTALVTGSHVLIEDVPGLGKTTAAKALAKIIHSPTGDITFRRIQFTPDLLPYDITGVDVFDPGTQKFEFKPGPVFTDILLADEINRTTPKVQSALLEVMEERQVTVGQTTRPLGPLFFVIATQNPIEMEGTYPLPAAQLDRFLMKLSVGYPSPEEEKRIYLQDPSHKTLPNLHPSVDAEALLEVRAGAETVHVDPKILDLIFNLVEGTRNHKAVHLGVSPRGGVLFLKAVRVLALLRGRDFVIDQDVADLVYDVLAHRLHVKSPKTSARQVLMELLNHEMAKLP